jgi:D-arginine dehydrogenase
VIDINAYLWAFINGAEMGGARFLFGKKTADINIGPGDIIVNSAGAWSQEVANFFGAEDMGIRSYRRHLYCTPPMPKVDPKWPFVWDVENQYYFRPESGGLLLGPADEDESPPGVPKTDPRIKEVLAGKLAKFCPALAGVSIAREWCGLRTFAPDKKPVIRWDRKVKDFFWLTALGGRGVTCAASAGRMAASVIMSGADPAKR